MKKQIVALLMCYTVFIVYGGTPARSVSLVGSSQNGSRLPVPEYGADDSRVARSSAGSEPIIRREYMNDRGTYMNDRRAYMNDRGMYMRSHRDAINNHPAVRRHAPPVSGRAGRNTSRSSRSIDEGPRYTGKNPLNLNN